MKFAWLPILLLALIPTALAAEFPDPLGYVSDFAGILENSASLEQELMEYESSTTIEIAIVTVSGLLEGYDTSTYSTELFTKWGIGKADRDNGILVLIVKDGISGNRMWIQTGYEMEGYIPDSRAGRILDTALPDYITGNYSAATSKIVEGLKQALESYEPGKQPESGFLTDILVGGAEFLIWIIILIVFGVAASFFGKPKCPKCKTKQIETEGEFSICKKCGKLSMRTQCPKCKSRDVRKEGGFYICNKCRKKFKKQQHHDMFFYMGGTGAGGYGGGGFGGFGGGGTGGGGAGR